MKDNNLYSVIPYKDQLLKLDQASKARAYYLNYYINLLTGEKISYEFKNWIELTKTILLSTKVNNPRVIHLFYELGFLIEQELNLLDDDSLLVIDIQFQRFLPVSSAKNLNTIKLKSLSSPNFKDYKKSFDTGYQELLKGNCYQFNLTFPYQYSFNKNVIPDDFIFSLWRQKSICGSYGSATNIPFINKLFLSNSPECLFQHKNKVLSTMPIKGTLKRRDSDDWKSLWEILSTDKKNQAELYMISDLLRNDLSRIELPRAQVVKKKFPKLVPGLIHQCSQIDVELSDTVNLWRIIEKIFPGGSITGAPKKRAIRLIHALEKRERGFYCGSTIILFREMKSASINIRSSVIDFESHLLHYQAGGGITLLSDAQEEFQEMTYKHNSFIHPLTL